MGAIWFRRSTLVGAASETVGYKAGLALSREDLHRHTRDMGLEDWWYGDDEERLRIRSEEFQEAIEQLLFAVGNIPIPRVAPPNIALLIRYKGKAGEMAAVTQVLDIVAGLPRDDGPLDLTQLIIQATTLGPLPTRIAMEFVEALEIYTHANPWSRVRRHSWNDVAQLRELFESASLSTQYGTFVDQRFIDYLDANFDRIDEIHWRKFEGLAAEFFDKLGWKVAIGPGGNDDGVDVRVWHPGSDQTSAPAILIQCKRQKEQVGKVVVKALWADVVNEKAESGLIVTTSKLAPGAARVSEARSYPVRQAGRPALREWIQQMRSPNTGAFLSE